MILVTGASGFLGNALCRALVAERADVRALVRPGTLAPAGTAPAIAAGLHDARALEAALRGVHTVLHLAAHVHVPGAAAGAGADEFHRVNVQGSRALLEAAVQAGVQRFVFFSSVKAVGEFSDVPWNEAEPPRPADPYGETKLEAERIVGEIAGRAGIHAPILRLPLSYGPGAKGNILRLFDAVDRGQILPFGAVHNRRSLLFSGNLAAAVAAVLAAPAAGRETFFVSDNADLSTPELIRLIGDALGRMPRLVSVPVPVFRAAARVGDFLGHVGRVPFDSGAQRRLLGSLAVDVGKLRSVTGYSPPFSPPEGLAAMAAWYRSRR